MDIEDPRPEQVEVMEVVSGEVTLGQAPMVALDEFDRMTDRELLLNLNRKLRYFEGLFLQLGAQADSNPMMKMMFGKLFKQ